MADHNIAEQMLVEHGMLKHIVEGLRAALGWESEGDDFSRKLHTVRFIARCLQRHLDHMLTLEEYDGYMDAVVNLSPQLSRRVDALRQEHDQFRKATLRIVHRLENVLPTDQSTFRNVCEELLALLDALDHHRRKEGDVLQEAFGKDGGGEG
jgi:hemerythrin-like domain-containing protein